MCRPHRSACSGAAWESTREARSASIRVDLSRSALVGASRSVMEYPTNPAHPRCLSAAVEYAHLDSHRGLYQWLRASCDTVVGASAGRREDRTEAAMVSVRRAVRVGCAATYRRSHLLGARAGRPALDSALCELREPRYAKWRGAQGPARTSTAPRAVTWIRRYSPATDNPAERDNGTQPQLEIEIALRM